MANQGKGMVTFGMVKYCDGDVELCEGKAMLS